MRTSTKHFDAIAVNALGMGARAGEFQAAKSDPQGWVLSHLSHPPVITLLDDNLPSSHQIIVSYYAQIMARRKTRLTMRADPAAQKTRGAHAKTPMLDIYRSELQARNRHAVMSRTSFCERWVRFWSNHFTVSGRNNLLKGLAGSHEREAIRPFVFGSFHELLERAVLHPAMLIYLNNNSSTGPRSSMGDLKGKSYNENLAREVLELHTLDQTGGYTSADIISFAKALTGWRVKLNLKQPSEYGAAVFLKVHHEPGPQHFMGQTFKDDGADQAINILKWLSVQPQTARFVARKIAVHFVADPPPPTLMSALEHCFLETKGDLLALAQTLIRADETWAANDWTFKTPEEFVISVGRAFPDTGIWTETDAAASMGQPTFLAPSPQGWPAAGDDWVNAEGLLGRLTWLRAIAPQIPNWVNAEYLIEEALGGYIGADTRALTQRLTRGIDALRTVILSPEFMQR